MKAKLNRTMQNHGDHDHSDHGHEWHDPGESASHTTDAADEPTPEPAGPVVRIQPAVVQQMGVNTAVVQRRSITRAVRAVAHIDFAENAEAVVNARYDGWVEKLYADTSGTRVRRGQALAGIYSPELVATQEEYLQLYRNYRLAQSERALAAGDVATTPNPNEELKQLLDAARRRLEFWNISAAQIRALEKRGRASRLLSIHAPISGVIVDRQIVAGAKITEGTDLFRIVKLDRVWAYMHIPEKDIPFVKTGLPVEMTVPQVPGESFAGRIDFIFPYMERETRDLRVRVSFRNAERRLKPGMFATLQLNNTLDGEWLSVPASAVIRTGERQIVFVYRGNGAFEPREITVGASDADDHLQVLSGLRENEAVVTSGQFLLDSESRIQAAVNELRAESTGHGGHQP